MTRLEPSGLGHTAVRMSYQMPNRIALVTGTSSGLGDAVARQLLERDWRVVGFARRDPQIRHEHYQHVSVDLGDTPLLARIVAPRLDAAFGEARWARVALVNNAAHAGFLGPLTRTEAEAFSGVLATNVVAPAWLMGQVARRTPAETPLRIVNVSSAAAVRGIAGLGAYCTSKAGLRMAGMALAAEEEAARARGTHADIAILSFEPGTVDTPMQETARTSSRERLPSVSFFVRLAAEGHLVPPSAPAGDIVAFLDSDDEPLFSERRHAGR